MSALLRKRSAQSNCDPSLSAISGLMHRNKATHGLSLFDDLVGADEQRRQHLEAGSLGGFEVDD